MNKIALDKKREYDILEGSLITWSEIKMITTISVAVPGQGLHAFTEKVQSALNKTELLEGLCTLFIQHTSASLLIQENYDPSAQCDLEAWINRLVPERDPLYTHTLEGDDDMPAHIKAAITATSISIPYTQGQLALGSWQGIYLWEHRRMPTTRKVVVHFGD